MSTSALSWSSEFGPTPLATTWLAWTKGLAGPTSRAKKNTATT
jgi:hypothetical protein